MISSPISPSIIRASATELTADGISSGLAKTSLTSIWVVGQYLIPTKRLYTMVSHILITGSRGIRLRIRVTACDRPLIMPVGTNSRTFYRTGRGVGIYIHAGSTRRSTRKLIINIPVTGIFGGISGTGGTAIFVPAAAGRRNIYVYAGLRRTSTRILRRCTAVAGIRFGSRKRHPCAV